MAACRDALKTAASMYLNNRKECNVPGYASISSVRRRARVVYGGQQFSWAFLNNPTEGRMEVISERRQDRRNNMRNEKEICDTRKKYGPFWLHL